MSLPFPLAPEESRCPGQRRFPDAVPFPGLEGRHPCFSLTPEGHGRAGRLHLPVSPSCNITCRFCRRDFNRDEIRPGVARRLVAPEQAVAVVARALELCPDISVVGIAGPGDTLCTDHALRAFTAIHQAFPDLLLCLSTNGLRLADQAGALHAAGVGTITVTVNAVDPAIEAEISPIITDQGRRLEGRAAACRLIERQLAGIRAVAALGAIVKVNMVLIPGLNDHHVAAVAAAVAAAGAGMINLIPLLPGADFADRRAPTAAEVEAAQAEAGRHLTVFSHCRRCRADACGIPGKTELSAALYGAEAGQDATFSHG